jgi:cation diffusion facilitator family transporter
MDAQERYEIGNRISKITICWNIILAVAKVLAGVIGKSNAMLADGVHSLSDVISTVAVMIGLKFSNKPEDEDHPYGHEKIEPIVAKLLASVLFITALGIGYNAIHLIASGTFLVPGMIAIYAAVVSIVIKEWMYQYTVKGAKKIESSVLLADAWHHRSDALSSVGTLIGIIGARMGFPILDPIASLVVCVLIGKVAIEIYMEAIKQLIDESADQETMDTIRKYIVETEGVLQIDVLSTRVHANKLYVDVEIAVNADLSLEKAHDIAEAVHHRIESYEKRVKHCMVHVNPYRIPDIK